MRWANVSDYSQMIDEVARVRRFNRTVTQRIGALDDHYLSRGRSLGEARVLWEIGEAGCDVRALRSRLDLDAGYLSRLLRSLESDGLVTVGTSPTDRRGGRGRPPPPRRRAGGAAPARERPPTARRRATPRSAWRGRLSPGERQRLVRGMADAERLLVGAVVQIEV